MPSKTTEDIESELIYDLKKLKIKSKRESTKDDDQLRKIFTDLDENQFNNFFDKMKISIRWWNNRTREEPICVLKTPNLKRTRVKMEIVVKRSHFKNRSVEELRDELKQFMTDLLVKTNTIYNKEIINTNQIHEKTIPKAKLKKSVTFTDLRSLDDYQDTFEKEKIHNDYDEETDVDSDKSIHKDQSQPVIRTTCVEVRTQSPKRRQSIKKSVKCFPVLFRLPKIVRDIEREFMCDQRLKELDPNPDIQVLFKEYDKRFFNGLLSHNEVELSWSYRLRVTSGMTYGEDEERPIRITLSHKLLTGRPRVETVTTLIHEMIHAWDFIVNGFDSICSDHGKNWQNKAKEIERKTGLKIGIYHDLEFNPKEYFKILQMKKEKLAEEMKNYRRICCQTNDKFVVKEFLDYLSFDSKMSKMTKDPNKRNEFVDYESE